MSQDKPRERGDMPSHDDSLELSEIKERFEASTVSLDEVRRRLTALGDLQEKRATASEGLAKASEELRLFTSTALEVVEGLRSAQTSATGAFDSMRAAVDGTELRQLAQDVVAIDGRLSDALEKLAQTLDGLQASVDEVRGAVAAQTHESAGVLAGVGDTLRSEVTRLESKLEALVQTLSRSEESAIARAQESQAHMEELARRLDDLALSTQDRDERESELARVRGELARAQESFAKLSSVAGDRALRKAGLKEGSTSAGLFG